MCEPATATLLITSIALSAASAGVSYYGANQAAGAQAKYQKELADIQKQASMDQMTQVRQQQMEEQAATAQKLLEVQKQGLEAKGELQSTAASSGTSGVNLDALYREYGNQESGYIFALREQQRLNDLQHGHEVEAIRTGEWATQRSTMSPINRPSLLGTVLQVGAQAAQSYGNYRSGQQNPNLMIGKSTSAVQQAQQVRMFNKGSAIL